ncbi:MAG: hypothetical protein HRU17_05475 [Polyangiaceae bacterium]|nr:hypothetical protein [Polyangiaceae bacterium]
MAIQEPTPRTLAEHVLPVEKQDSALVGAAALSLRYISDRFLPDKALDLVDEVAAKIKMEIDSVPFEINQLQRNIQELKIEEQALKRERDPASKKRLGTLREEVDELAELLAVGRSRWLKEKDVIFQIRAKQKTIEELRADEEQARRDGNLGRAAEVQYGTIPAAELAIEELRAALAKVQGDQAYLKEEVWAMYELRAPGPGIEIFPWVPADQDLTQ